MHPWVNSSENWPWRSEMGIVAKIINKVAITTTVFHMLIWPCVCGYECLKVSGRFDRILTHFNCSEIQQSQKKKKDHKSFSFCVSEGKAPGIHLRNFMIWSGSGSAFGQGGSFGSQTIASLCSTNKKTNIFSWGLGAGPPWVHCCWESGSFPWVNCYFSRRTSLLTLFSFYIPNVQFFWVNLSNTTGPTQPDSNQPETTKFYKSRFVPETEDTTQFVRLTLPANIGHSTVYMCTTAQTFSRQRWILAISTIVWLTGLWLPANLNKSWIDGPQRAFHWHVIQWDWNYCHDPARLSSPVTATGAIHCHGCRGQK